MSSIASDTCDYDMGDYGCDDEGYGCEDNGYYGGYDDSHDQEPNENEIYHSGGEYERNVEHNSYGEDREEEDSCGSLYDDVGACERSYSHSEGEDGSYDDAGTCYTSHSQDEGKVKYNNLLYKKYEEHAPKACEDSYSYYCANLYPSRSSMYGYTSSSQSHPRGRRECATQSLRILYHIPLKKGLALGWWTQEERLRKLQGNTHALTWEGLKGLMRFKYVPKGYTKLFNVDPRRLVLRTKVGICGALGFDLVIDDGYNLNYITPEVVAYLGLPRLQRTYPYTMEECKVAEGCVVDHWGTHLFPPPKVKSERQKIERSKGKQGGNLKVEKGEPERSEVRGLPQSQSNIGVHPSLGKDS
ncbi:hypothetical protein KY290_008159 [Solanum tuberosum]|uniref:Uncharacterized protein n=1 Tax=Solanum tuberosum TaxID=4113 RepID=A0ABQ7W7P0_SOLTU|nr:hypothetical protein KY290_008159 [Solanum tuberosum]